MSLNMLNVQIHYPHCHNYQILESTLKKCMFLFFENLKYLVFSFHLYGTCHATYYWLVFSVYSPSSWVTFFKITVN